jgi:hypothetical protein
MEDQNREMDRERFLHPQQMWLRSIGASIQLRVGYLSVEKQCFK